MTDLNDILDDATQWATEGITKPTITTEQLLSISQFNRGIVVRLLSDTDELMGVIDRRYFTPESHDAWSCKIASTSLSDLKDIKNTIKRIIAEYDPTSEENILEWQSATYGIFNNVRFTYTLVIILRKAVIAGY